MAAKKLRQIDPTRNVTSLVKAGLKHEKAMRKKDQYIAELRAEHAKDMRQAEAERIDAIRAVDVGAVQRAAEVQATQAATLAGQVATTADAFRASLASALAPIQASIEDLRRAQYEAQGQKTQVVETRAGSSVNMQAAAIVISAILLAVALYAALHK